MNINYFRKLFFLFISILSFSFSKAQDKTNRKEVQINSMSSVYVIAPATEEEGKMLGEYLEQVGFFDTQKARGVQLAKKKGTFIVSFIVEVDKPYLKQHPEIRENFTSKATELSQNAFKGNPVKVELINGGFRVL